MKNFLFNLFAVVGLLAFASPVFAQGMMGTTYWSTGSVVDSALQQEESQGADLWQKFQRQELTCAVATPTQFELLGEYFMGQMMGDAHAAMNARLKTSLGEEGESQMHITLAKRVSGCDTSAVYPNGYIGFMPMMGMMFSSEEGWNGGFTNRTSMMNNMYRWYGANGWTGWVIVLLWWILILFAVLLFVNWVMHLQTGGHPGHDALEHLKIRYAKGEIDKKTFDRLRKELT